MSNAPTTSTALRCNVCGATITNRAAAFCPQCGRALARPAPAAALPRTPSGVPKRSGLWALLIATIFIGMLVSGIFVRFNRNPHWVLDNRISTNSDGPQFAPPVTDPPDNAASSTIPQGAVRSTLIGSPTGTPFTHVDPQGRPVLGFQVQLQNVDGRMRVADLTPIFSRDDPAANGKNVAMANEGYAVGGMYVVGYDAPEAVSIVFMPLEGNHLAPGGGYTSGWFGQTEGTRQLLDSQGNLVLGAYGSRGDGLNGLGLIFSRRE